MAWAWATRRTDYLLPRPDALVVLQRQVAQDLLPRFQGFHEAGDGGGPVVVGAAEVEHYDGVVEAHEVEDAGGVEQLVDAAPGRLGVRAPRDDELAGVHAQADAQRTGEGAELAQVVAVLFRPVVGEGRVVGEGEQPLPHPEEADAALGVPADYGLEPEQVLPDKGAQL